ncbi:MAG: hypothetical protein HYZ31_13620 [Gammaproteobacteria bacterium]|jgi:hypothetical protein|nr:hypothetical protein [Gammaproteobacteria bacterium]
MNTQSNNPVVLLPSWLRHGNTESDQPLDSLPDIQATILEATSNTLRTIRINTPNLEYDIYDNDPFISALTSFVRGNRHASIQVLVQNSNDAIQRGHGLIRLAQRLTSSIEIRKPGSEDNFNNSSFIVFDNAGFLYRHTGSHAAVYNNQCKQRATRLLELFTPAWEQAEQDPETRRLSL